MRHSQLMSSPSILHSHEPQILLRTTAFVLYHPTRSYLLSLLSLPYWWQIACDQVLHECSHEESSDALEEVPEAMNVH